MTYVFRSETVVHRGHFCVFGRRCTQTVVRRRFLSQRRRRAVLLVESRLPMAASPHELLVGLGVGRAPVPPATLERAAFDAAEPQGATFLLVSPLPTTPPRLSRR